MGGEQPVVHMVTLVTMAMVTTAQPLPYKAQHLVVQAPEEEKVEDLLDVAETRAGGAGREGAG